ncbi:Flp pilus assembly protein CpaB [Litorimonas sp. RW-G-Af-16]|uniref:Flp pilus assembly protein CpaB n=1 Tax=Litorimonas sp. RW-G-Af-16 TaxID=3241168 RepID=UPI00390C7CD6
MMNTKKIILMGAMLLMAGVIFTQVKKLNAPQEFEAPAPTIEKVKYERVLAASEDLGLGARVGSSSLRWIDWPEEALNPSLVTETNRPDATTELENSIVRSPITEGEPINLNKLVQAGDSGVMAALLSPGMRAVTTRISVDTAAGGFIQPGDRVDVILRQSFRIEQSKADKDKGGIRQERLVLANTVLENVKVLAIDQEYSVTAENEAYVIGSTATFELNQEDAELLQEAAGAGDISLTLRGMNRPNARSQSVAVKERETLSDKPKTLTIYRSGQPTRVAVEEQ